MRFAEELLGVLPADLARRDAVIAGAARHLELIVEANRQFNLTRIVEPREAAIKHVADSVIPWRRFEGFNHIVDVGSGAGFPGIPLALALPGARFTLLESTQKKARFIESVVEELALDNVSVVAERAEDWMKSHTADCMTARAVAPLDRALGLFAAHLRKGGRILLYKGSDAAREVAGVERRVESRGWRVQIVEQYELPDEAGTRAIVEVRRAS